MTISSFHERSGLQNDWSVIILSIEMVTYTKILRRIIVMERNRFVDILKGILIIFVIILHFPFETTQIRQYLFPFHLTMSVPCFMMLSGYVSALSFQKQGFEDFKDTYKFLPLAKKNITFYNTLHYCFYWWMDCLSALRNIPSRCEDLWHICFSHGFPARR